MLKLAARTFDVYDDADMEIARNLASSLGAVKVAERDEVEALEDNQFGLVMKTAGGVLRRRYPLHDTDATKLSRAYFEVVRNDLPLALSSQVDIKIAAAEQLHGILDAGIKLADQTIILEKVAYVNGEDLKQDRKVSSYDKQIWGLTIDGKSYFPLHDATLVRTAEARFRFTAAELAPHEKFEYARNIVKQAAAFGLEIARDSAVNNYTNDEVNVDALNLALDARKQIMKAAGLETEIVDQLRLAAGCLPDRGDIEKDASWNQRLAKLAAIQRLPADRVVAILQGIDKLAGFCDHHYARGLADPFAACFKRADALPQTVVDGVDLAKIQPHRLAAAFDGDFVKEFTSNPVQVYSSLPAPVKVMVRGLAEEGMSQEPAGATQQPAPHPIAGGDPQQVLSTAYTNATGPAAF